MKEKNKFQLAISTAGHDKGSWYAVVGCEPRDSEFPRFVYIADGRRRKLDKPKKKSIKHIKITRNAIEICGLNDKQIRNALWEYNFGSKGGAYAKPKT